ncbi:MAG: hypothetical protein ACUVTM_01370 [Candidatus Bathyarchaeia archaeon]
MTSTCFVKTAIIIIILFIATIPNLLLIAHANAEGTSQDKGALQIMTLDSSDYAYGVKSIPEVMIEGGTVRVDAKVKILRFQKDPSGILLQIDFRETQKYSQELRFSFRFANDGSILCYYPYIDSSAAVTIRKGWVNGEWVNVSVLITQDQAKLYLNSEFVGANDPKYPARTSRFFISNIGIGKTDAYKLSVEAFISRIQLTINGTIVFLDDFEDASLNYYVKKSTNSIFRIIDVERYYSIEAEAKPHIASPGETVTLRAKLLDESLKGIENRIVIFEHKRDDRWERLIDAPTLKNGTATSSWTIPHSFPIGETTIRARFPGDDRFPQKISREITVTIIPKPATSINTGYAILLTYTIVLFTMFLFGLKPGGIQIIRFLIGTLCSISIYLTLPILTSSINIFSYIGYAQRIVKVEYFGPETDRILWMASMAFLSLAWIALHGRKIFEYRLSIIPSLLATLSIIAYTQGGGIIATLLTVATVLVVLWFPNVREAPSERIVPRMTFIISLLMIMLTVELGSIFGWLYNIFDPHVPFDGDVRWTVTSLEANIFGLLYPLTIPLLTMTFFAWIWIEPTRIFARTWKHWRGRDDYHNERTISSERLTGGKELRLDNICRRRWLNQNLMVFLVTLPLVSILSILVVYYPYFYSTKLIGVDTPWYYRNLLAMMEPDGLWRAIHDYGAASRLPYLLALYAIKLVTSMPAEFIVKVGPAVPSIFVGLAMFHLTRSLTCDNVLATYSAFLSLFSITTTVGIYAGVFANWLALGWVIIFLTVFLRMWQRFSLINVLASVLTSLIVLVTHAWTWAVLIVAISLSFILNLLVNSTSGNRQLLKTVVKTMLPILLVNIVMMVMVLALYREGEFIRLSMSGLSSVRVENLINLSRNITFTIQYYVGGFLANPPMLLLTILGLYNLRGCDEQLSSIFNSLLIVTSLPLLFVDSWWQWRLIYVVPYQIPATFGTATILRKLTGLNNRSDNVYKTLLLLIVTLVMFNYSLRCLNFIPS